MHESAYTMHQKEDALLLCSLVFGVTATAAAAPPPCKLYIGNGMYAPCPPDVTSTGPGAPKVAPPWWSRMTHRPRRRRLRGWAPPDPDLEALAVECDEVIYSQRPEAPDLTDRLAAVLGDTWEP